MIIVTGGAGFIGSNLVRRLNQEGHDDIIVVDDMTDGRKFFNLANCTIRDLVDVEDFYGDLQVSGKFPYPVEAVFHQGACTTTTEWDGRLMLRLNYEYSRYLLDACLADSIPFIYASSASIYGNGRESTPNPAFENPINVYAYSKLLLDQHIRRVMPDAGSQIVGLRYFNVYGPHEAHKGAMASVIMHFHRQLQDGDEVRLFTGSDGFADGEQRRDFIFVDDVVSVNMWMFNNPKVRGIFNLGTGGSRPFNDVAKATIASMGKGNIQYIPFPDSLRGSYQSFTEADISELRAAGYAASFHSVEDGVSKYIKFLQSTIGA
jgi:ADP-L-glycero-D-manno-heptose 6-epimerase